MNKEVKELIETLKEYGDGFSNVLAPTEESIKALLDYINQLETNRDEAIKLMRKKSKLVKKGELCHFAFYDMQMDDVSEVLEILERGKE